LSAFNPDLHIARAGIIGDYYHQQYMFWFAPMIGAAITAIIYGLFSYPFPSQA
jgi:glycerol uptake facilitator-like aquaporin